MSDSIVIEIDGIRYEGFKDASVFKAMDTIAGSFTFIATSDDVSVFPIKNGSPCKVYVNEIQMIDGFVEKLAVSYNAATHFITVNGRDKTADIIDSSIEGNVEFNTPITLEKIILNVLSSLGITNITVTSNIGTIKSFTKSELISGSVGQNAFDFIQAYCRKRQVIPAVDNTGNIILQRAGTEEIIRFLLNKKSGEFNNIISANIQYDNTERFNVIKAKSQANTSSSDSSSSNVVNNIGSASDNNIRSTRMLTIISENSSDDFTVKDRAAWEVNIRRARSMNYTVNIQGFSYDNGKNIWMPNRLVNVIDEYSDISGQFLIRSVNYSLSNEAGSGSSLTLIVKDAYTLEAEQSDRDTSADKAGDSLLERLGLQ